MYYARIANGTGDGNFSPLNNITVSEFAAIMMRGFYRNEIGPPASGDAWYTPYIKAAEWRGILRNMQDPSPDAIITRNDAAVLLYNILTNKGVILRDAMSQYGNQISGVGNVPYTTRMAITTCYAAGLMQGRGGNGFCGEETMTRAEAAAVYFRLLDYLEANGAA